jgi:hypothetical protein
MVAPGYIKRVCGLQRQRRQRRNTELLLFDVAAIFWPNGQFDTTKVQSFPRDHPPEGEAEFALATFEGQRSVAVEFAW